MGTKTITVSNFDDFFEGVNGKCCNHEKLATCQTVGNSITPLFSICEESMYLLIVERDP